MNKVIVSNIEMTFEENIHNWIEKFLSIPNTTFSNLPPCPFAKQAMLEDKIQCVELKAIDRLSIGEYFICELENFSYHWPRKKEVVILGCDPQLITSEELSRAVGHANDQFLHNRGYIALEDHPDEEEKVNEVILNNGQYAIVFLQDSKKLNTARTALQKQNYYVNWDAEYYADVTEI